MIKNESNVGFAIFPVLVIVFILGALGVSVYQVQQNQNIINKAYDPEDVPEPNQDSPTPPPESGCGGVSIGSAVSTCQIPCSGGLRGTCGGHKYCEGDGLVGECVCETEDDTCQAEISEGCGPGECYEGECVSTEVYWECDSSCGDGMERKISKQKSNSGVGCDYLKLDCRPNASCNVVPPSGNCNPTSDRPQKLDCTCDEDGCNAVRNTMVCVPQPGGGGVWESQNSPDQSCSYDICSACLDHQAAAERGDFDNSGRIDPADFGLLFQEYGIINPSNPNLDLDKKGDGGTIIDYGILHDLYLEQLSH